jgi:hypothetical protein
MIFSSQQEVDAYIKCIRNISLKDQVEVFIYDGGDGGTNKFVSGSKTGVIERVKVACVLPQVPVILLFRLLHDGLTSRGISIPRVILAANSKSLIYLPECLAAEAQDLFRTHYTGPLIGWTFKSVDENCRIAKIIKAK